MVIPQKHYGWECDYGDRSPIFYTLGVMLKMAGPYEMPMVALFVNNSPYNFEFYVIFGFETATDAQITMMHEMMTKVGARSRSDLTLEVMLSEVGKRRFNTSTVIDDIFLDFARRALFLSPERKDVAKVWPVDPIKKRVHVFLSHSSKDKSYVQSFMAYMIGEGVPIWYDAVEIDYGDNITETIQKGIGASGGVVFFITHAFLTSNWCKREMHTFIRKNIEDPRMWIGIVCSALVLHGDLPEFLRDLKYLSVDYSSDPKLAAVELSAAVKRRFKSNLA